MKFKIIIPISITLTYFDPILTILYFFSSHNCIEGIIKILAYKLIYKSLSCTFLLYKWCLYGLYNEYRYPNHWCKLALSWLADTTSYWGELNRKSNWLSLVKSNKNFWSGINTSTKHISFVVIVTFLPHQLQIKNSLKDKERFRAVLYHWRREIIPTVIGYKV